MKITFLGTSHGIPEADRVLSSAMIEVGDNIYLVDAGAPITEKMISIKKIMSRNARGNVI